MGCTSLVIMEERGNSLYVLEMDKLIVFDVLFDLRSGFLVLELLAELCLSFCYLGFVTETRYFILL